MRSAADTSTERRDLRKDERFDLDACENWSFHNLAYAAALPWEIGGPRFAI
jgi:hypothetical protein